MSDWTEYVYLIGCEENDVVKIGRTQDLKVRLAAIQRMSPVRVKVIWRTEGGTALESRLHKAFRARRVYGEWFDFVGSDPVELVQSAVKGELQDDFPHGYAHGRSPITPQAGEARSRSKPSRDGEVWVSKVTGRPIRSWGGGII